MATKLITLITGANQGIGYHAAQRLAADGHHHVLLGSRDLAKGQKAVADMLGAGDVQSADIEAIQIDVDSDDSIKAAAEIVEARYGRLDILINNAGINGTNLLSLPLRAQFQAVYNTNVFGAAITTNAFLPLLHESPLPGGKRIVFVSSSMGSLTGMSGPQRPPGIPDYLVYPSSKTAENALTLYYANTLGRDGFTVTSVCPGYCDTNMNGGQGTKPAKAGADAILVALGSEKEEVHLQFVHAEGGGGRYPW